MIKWIKKITWIDAIVFMTMWFMTVFVLNELFLVMLTGVYFLATNRAISFKINKVILKEMGKIISLGFLINLIFMLMFKNQVESTNQKTIVETLLSGGMNTVIMSLYIVIAAPVVEEFLFRGILQEFIGKINKKLGFILSMSLFAGMHLMPSFLIGIRGIKLFVELIPYLTISFMICYFYYKHENLGQCIILHCIWNSIALIMVGIQVL